MKASFIIPVHNEDKNIAKTLTNLIKLYPYIDYEVVIGLDACTDNTELIVIHMCTPHPNFKYFIFEERQGKTKMINQLIKEATGDIIIMNDADWLFDYNTHDWDYMMSLFKTGGVHGIADPYPVTWPIREEAGVLEIGTTLYGMVWIDAVKQHAQEYIPGYNKLDKNYFPLLVNIFRKDSYKENETLADDFERCLNIFHNNKVVLVHATLDPMRMKSSGEEYSITGIFKQKKRTALARHQLNELYSKDQIKIPKWDLLKSIWRNVIKPCKIKYIWSFSIVTILYILGNIFKPKGLNTTEGWNMRGR